MISRRRFLRTSLLGAFALGLAGVIGRHASGYRLDAATASRLRIFSPKEFLIFQAVARRVLAPDGDAPSADTVEAALAADTFLQKVPAELAGDLQKLLHLFEHTASATSRFTHLDAEDQDAVLAAWQKSRLGLRRQGFQALRTLAFMGYYRDARTWPLLGYTGPMKK